MCIVLKLLPNISMALNKICIFKISIIAELTVPRNTFAES